MGREASPASGGYRRREGEKGGGKGIGKVRREEGRGEGR